MDVINFSGGGPQTDPLSDALIEAVRNVSAAGVVPVISAGNDRDDYGVGSAGSPGSAPDAISVAALSNSHVYAPALSVSAPGTPEALTRIPFARTAGPATPSAWATADQTIVDVGTILGTNGQPVPRDLCGPPGNLDGGPSPLPGGSLNGAIALVSRGTCTFALKAQRVKAAGGIGIVIVDNRPGEANPIPVQLDVRGGMIADLDGQQLRAFLAGRGGRTTVRIGGGPRDLVDGPRRRRHELLLGRPDRLRPPAEAGRRRARWPDPLRDASARRRPVRRLRRDEHGRAARRRRRCAPAPAPSRTGRRCRSSLHSSRLPRPRGRTRHARSRRRS